MLKETAESVVPAVTGFFNILLISEKLPSEWKAAQVTPISKSSLSSDPANYRPVSLLSILSKLLVEHVQAFLFEHLEEHF